MVGGVYKYNYEYFTTTDCKFKCIGAITPSCSLKTFPLSYKLDSGSSFSEGFINAKLPICSWDSDVYVNWLTQNSVNVGASLVSGAIQTIGGLGLMATGAGSLAGAGSVASGALSIANTLGQIRQHSIAPDQAQGNINAGDITFAYNRIYPTFFQMSIKTEYAKIIDDYFSMYGYKVNSLKVPNLTGRRNWNYIQTIGANIEGNIPQTDIDELKNIFNNGITLWHNTNTYLDYSQNNDII